jgi:hypothetical protein
MTVDERFFRSISAAGFMMTTRSLEGILLLLVSLARRSSTRRQLSNSQHDPFDDAQKQEQVQGLHSNIENALGFWIASQKQRRRIQLEYDLNALSAFRYPLSADVPPMGQRNSPTCSERGEPPCTKRRSCS